MPGGIFCLWLPMYQLTEEEFLVIAKSMATTFPRVTLWQLGSVIDNSVVALAGSETLATDKIISAMGSYPMKDAPDAALLHDSISTLPVYKLNP